jgi:Fe-S-cluster containining protein
MIKVMQPEFITPEECLKCKVCCRFSDIKTDFRPYLDSKEVQDLSCYTKKIYLPHIDNRRGTRIIPQKKDGFICPFFNLEKNSCSIYEKRPFDCRLYPFVVMENKERNGIVVGADISCHSIRNAIGKYGFQKYVNYLQNHFAGYLIEYIEKNPFFVMEYQDCVQELFLLKSFPEGLKKISIKDSLLISDFLTKYKRCSLSFYSFAPIYVWKNVTPIYWKIIEDCLYIFINAGGWFLLLPPIGKDKKHLTTLKLKTAFDILDNLNCKHSPVSRIENLQDWDCCKELKNVRQSDTEYVCISKEIAELKGNKYKSKRASCNYFEKHNDFQYKKFQQDDIEQCIDLYLRWAEEKIKSTDEYHKMLIADALFAHIVGFQFCQELGLQVRAVCVNNKVQGYTFGFAIDEENFCVLFEIANKNIKGLAQWMFKMFCKENISYKYINLMGDSGLENLKGVKKSYHPIKQEPIFTGSMLRLF